MTQTKQSRANSGQFTFWVGRVLDQSIFPKDQLVFLKKGQGAAFSGARGHGTGVWHGAGLSAVSHSLLTEPRIPAFGWRQSPRDAHWCQFARGGRRIANFCSTRGGSRHNGCRCTLEG